MLKKISVKQLILGMHIKEFCGSRMEHPFWRTAFVLTDPKDIEAILASSIKEVWIDSAKGLDVAPGEIVVSEAETEAQVSAEFARAAKICAQSKRAVTSMFQEARMGKAVDTASAQKLVEEISASVSRNPNALISLARLHHTKIDGSGYPQGIKGNEISLYSRMAAVCDVYDAISSGRPYKSAWDPAESMRKMAEWTNLHFDPVVFHAFVKSIGIYPVGALVRLDSGRLGIVIAQSAASLLTPKLKVFF